MHLLQISSIGVDSNMTIVIFIVLGVNGPLLTPTPKKGNYQKKLYTTGEIISMYYYFHL